MEKDPRFKAVRALLKKKEIASFRDIFIYIPRSTVAKYLSINNNRMLGLINNPSRFTLKDIHRLADLFEYDYFKLLELIVKDIEKPG